VPDTTLTDTTGLFTEAAAHYVRGRAGYPSGFIETLVSRFGLADGGRVIDVGCGPGLLALPLARAGASVLGIDPNGPMLEAGRAAAADSGVPVTFSKRPAEALTAADGPARLVTFGRSFHWTDRPRVLSLLDGIVEPGGGIAIVHEDREQRRTTPTGMVIEAMKRDWVTDDLPSRNRDGDAALLSGSAFGLVERSTATMPRTWTADEVLGHLLSTSYFNPGRLGDRREAFEADLRGRLRAVRADGVFEETLGFVMLIATRKD
jgi:SAM-dependent methyltransferase